MLSGISLPSLVDLAEALRVKCVDTTFGSDIHLFKNNIIPTINSALADFTEADFVGYVKQTGLLAWGKIPDPSQGGYRIYLPTNSIFTAGALTGSQTVYGWYISNHLDTVLAGWGVFDTPVTFSVNGQGIVVEPNFYLSLQTGQSNLANP
jgi:hypothetical protein